MTKILLICILCEIREGREQKPKPRLIRCRKKENGTTSIPFCIDCDNGRGSFLNLCCLLFFPWATVLRSFSTAKQGHVSKGCPDVVKGSVKMSAFASDDWLLSRQTAFAIHFQYKSIQSLTHGMDLVIQGTTRENLATLIPSVELFNTTFRYDIAPVVCVGKMKGAHILKSGLLDFKKYG